MALVSRSGDRLSAVARQCEARGARTMVVEADVSDRDAVEAAFEAAREAHGRLDAVIHSAAVLAYGRFEDVPAEVFDAALKTTVTGTANVARTALAHFRDEHERGRLVVVGSLLGKIATPYMSTYITAKWAVHGLVRTLQIEARETPGIEISLVSPGAVDTPVYRQAGTYLGRHGRPPPPVDPPEKVAEAVTRSLSNPRRERSVGLANGIVVAAFRLVPAVFDVMVIPLMRLGGLSGSGVPPGPGNVLSPHPPGESVTDGWNRWGGTRDRNDGERNDGERKDGERIETAHNATEETPVNLSSTITVERHVKATPEQVWAILADGWAYGMWVVGASRVRGVEDGWPQPGRRIHHSFGLWPLLIDDTTEVIDATAPMSLALQARGWPAGEATVVITITPEPTGSLIRVDEDATAGPGTLVPQPLRQVMIAPRNREALRRLAYLAEGRGQTSITGS